MLGRNLNLLYEDHIMSREDEDVPREPNYYTELHCNLEGMVKAWTRFGIYPSKARKASKGSSASHLTEQEEFGQWMKSWDSNDPRSKIMDVGPSQQRAGVAINLTWFAVSFDIHVRGPDCVAIILGGVCHDRGYVNMLESYLEEDPE
jgi:hypothetical protein